MFSIALSVQETVVSEEIMHNLDTCEVTVAGDELDGEHEGLELDMSQLQQHGLEMSSSNLGLVVTGTHTQLSKHICDTMVVWQKMSPLHEKEIL